MRSYTTTYDPVVVQGSMYPPSLRGYPQPGYYYVPAPTGIVVSHRMFQGIKRDMLLLIAYPAHVAAPPHMAPVAGTLTAQAPPSVGGIYHHAHYPGGHYGV